jgi:hypothetical protein
VARSCADVAESTEAEGRVGPPGFRTGSAAPYGARCVSCLAQCGLGGPKLNQWLAPGRGAVLCHIRTGTRRSRTGTSCSRAGTRPTSAPGLFRPRSDADAPDGETTTTTTTSTAARIENAIKHGPPAPNRSKQPNKQPAAHTPHALAPTLHSRGRERTRGIAVPRQVRSPLQHGVGRPPPLPQAAGSHQRRGGGRRGAPLRLPGTLAPLRSIALTCWHERASERCGRHVVPVAPHMAAPRAV